VDEQAERRPSEDQDVDVDPATGRVIDQEAERAAAADDKPEPDEMEASKESFPASDPPAW
jgi:hypothetical protein